MNGAGWLSELHTLRELFEFSAVIAILAAIPVFLMLLKASSRPAWQTARLRQLYFSLENPIAAQCKHQVQMHLYQEKQRKMLISRLEPVN